MRDDAELNAHDLLLRLAGRLPDDQLWRLRDWLASGALPVLRRALPRALLRDRIGLTVSEQGLLHAIGADPSLASSVLGVDAVPAHRYTFTPELPSQAVDGDSIGVVLGATLHGRAGIGDVRCSWRQAPAESPRRIVLVGATADRHRLTGELQRMLRALGEHEPCVEVLPREFELTPYHLAALDMSELLCLGAADLVHG